MKAVSVLSRVGTWAQCVAAERVVARKSAVDRRVTTGHLSVLANDPWVPYGVTVDGIICTAGLFVAVTAELLCVEVEVTVDTPALRAACWVPNTVDGQRAGWVPL